MATRTDAGNGSRRRAVRARVLAEESECALCGYPVDKSLTMLWGQHGPKCAQADCPGCSPHPLRAEVDEIVPRSKGGDPLDRSNCQLAHRGCNLAKGDGAQSAVVARVDYPVSQDW